MKRKIPAIILFIFIYGSLYSQSGWVWQNPYPQSNRIHDFSFLNSQTGFACGNDGTILKTTNGGMNWNVTTIFTFPDLEKIQVLTENIIYAIGTRCFLKSINGGLNWIVTVPIQQFPYNQMQFINETTGYIATIANIIYTTNAGVNWTPLTWPGASSSIFFFNDGTGFASGSGFIIYKTTNNGNSWINAFDGPGSCTTINFLNSMTGYATGTSGNFAKTTNRGQTWSSYPTGTSNRLYSISIMQPNLIVTGEYGTILLSSNEGINWNQVSPLDTDITINASHPISPNRIICGGEFGIMYISENSGLNWSPVSSGTISNLNDASFLNSKLGYVSGDNGTILKTTNAGAQWIAISDIPITENLFNIFFINTLTGFTSSASKFYKTSNGGLNWVIIANTTGGSTSFALHFINETTGFLGQNILYKTTDGGVNWLPVYTETIIDIQFLNETTGYGSTGVGHVVKTTNTGTNWQIINHPFELPNIIYDIDFLNDSLGFLTYYDGIHKSTNGGIDWFNIFPSNYLGYTFTDFNGVDFINENTGYLTCYGYYLPGEYASAVCKTTNGGINWVVELPGLRPLSLDYVSVDTCFLIGLFGSILRKTETINPVTIQGTSIPNNFSLHQNYPNPFNPDTKIRFDIPKSNNGITKLVVFDALGREIKILSEQSFSPGSYEIGFDASNLSTGIYYYTLRSGDYTETKKMMLIK